MKIENSLLSPCHTCSNTPCCTHLQVHTFSIATLMDIDQVFYFLNFEHIEAMIDAQWKCTLYYHQPCGFLSAENTCTIHNSEEQPQVCRNYNPYSCFYKTAMQNKEKALPHAQWITRERMEWLITAIEFNEERQIRKYPEWKDVIEGIRTIPLTKKPAAAARTEDEAMKEWENWVLNAVVPASAEEKPVTSKELRNACSGCSAYCCTHLVFPFTFPQNFAAIDYVKYCLGFPGVQVGIRDTEWTLIVKTSCRNLSDSKCMVYDQPERPLTCRYFAEQSCGYRTTIGKFRTPEYIRVNAKQFRWLEETLRFDKQGTLTGIPSVLTVRNFIEAKWREEKSTMQNVAACKT